MSVNTSGAVGLGVGVGSYQPGVYVPLKALFLVYHVIMFWIFKKLQVLAIRIAKQGADQLGTNSICILKGSLQDKVQIRGKT